MPTLTELAADLAAGRTTSRRLVEACLARIADPAGEGSRAFVAVDADKALAMADLADGARRLGLEASPYAGIPISIKDLFDIRGERTRAGSTVLDDRPPAGEDAVAVARLRAAGFVLIGRANMTEFAYSGLGMNAHHGTPLNPYGRTVGRIPGGSSSGGAVSVADGMAMATLGTDTGGSCRIPAGLCGITGFKPTARRVSRAGAIPLSTTLDSVGPLANSVRCCAILDAILSGEGDFPPVPVAGLRLALPRHYVIDALDGETQAAFALAVQALERAGAEVRRVDMAELCELPTINAKGGLVGAEAYAWHRGLIADRPERYDAWVLGRFEAGKSQSAADYIATLTARADLMARMAVLTAPFDAVIMPTTAIVAPTGRDGRPRGLDPHQSAAAAQHRGGQFPRPLRGVAALSPRRHPAGGPDADGRARRRPPAAGRRRGGGRRAGRGPRALSWRGLGSLYGLPRWCRAMNSRSAALILVW